MDTYTKEIRLRIQCPYCPHSACKSCISRYLLTTYDDPHCMECKRGWNREFIDMHLTKTFRTGDLRKHRAKILMEREKAFLPAHQIFVEGLKETRRILPLINEIAKKTEKYMIERRDILVSREKIARASRGEQDVEKKAQLYQEILENSAKYGKNEAINLMNVFERNELDRAYVRAQNQYNGNIEGTAQVGEAREFIQRCPSEGCRGYLSTAYKCGVCSKFTCAECLAVKGDSRDVAHTCDEDAKATASLIRRETKPCPKCGVRIYKIDGCDQMWCTQEGCHTAFSWRTGHVVTGVVHNPHYYEYLRQRNGGVPREIGDVPCGGLPQTWILTRRVQAITGFTLLERQAIYNIHRSVNDVLHERLPQFPARRPAGINRDINIRYLMNELTDVEWKKLLEQRESKSEKKKEIGQILTMFTHVASEHFQALEREANNLRFIAMWRDVSSKQLEELRQYTNKCLAELGKRMICAIPQIDNAWNYIPPRKEALREAAPAAPAAAPPATPTTPPPQQNTVITEDDYIADDAVVVE